MCVVMNYSSFKQRFWIRVIKFLVRSISFQMGPYAAQVQTSRALMRTPNENSQQIKVYLTTVILYMN